MALRIWLPLNGNLENKGISDYEIRSANITIADDGKIGKCYSFNGSNSYINITNFEIGNNWSYGCWVNTPNSDSRGWEIVMILNNSGSDADSQFAFWVHQKENRFESLANTQYVSTISYTNYYNNWHHFFATFNGTLLTTYIDGNVVNTKTITATQYNAVNLTIGARSTNAAGTSFVGWFQGKLNDIRIYDHCLSPLEVKEISQGLVLHYKLDGFCGGVGENIILTNSNFSNGTTGWSNWATVQSREIVTIKNKKWAHIVKTANAYGGYSRVITIKPNTVYTVSATFYASGTTKGILWWHYRSSEGGANLSQSSKSFDLTTIPQRYSAQIPIYTNANYTVDRLNLMIGTPTETFGDVDIYFTDIKIEEGSIATSYIQSNSEMGIDTSKIVDSSGYGNNGVVEGNITISKDSARYNYSTYFDNNADRKCGIFINNLTTPFDQYTISVWIKDSAAGKMSLGSNSSVSNTNTNFYLYGDNSWKYVHGGTSGEYYFTHNNPVTIGEWIHYGIVYDGSKVQIYRNGTNEGSKTTTGQAIFNNISLGIGFSAASYQAPSYMSDFRLYATALSAEDILDLYHTPANIDNLGGVHGFEMVEKQGNILSNVNIAITGALDKNLSGVGTYFQANCTVTYENNAIRIYRPPNITHNSSSMHNMWGGMRLRNSSVNSCHEYNENTDNIFGLQKNHTYVIYFTVKGQSSNAATSVGWTNQMGWGGGGLDPNPTNIEYLYTPVNFNGEMQCFYKFTISDDVVKTCTTAYSYATVGKQYLSYNDFMYGFGYENTGSLGTDVYVNNFRMFDITSLDNKNITLNGIVNFLSFNEENDNIAHIHKFGEMQVMNIIEK